MQQLKQTDGESLVLVSTADEAGGFGVFSLTGSAFPEIHGQNGLIKCGRN